MTVDVNIANFCYSECWLGADTKVTLQVSQKFEELQLIHNLRGQDSLAPALQVEVQKFLAGVDESSGFISDEVFLCHGTSISLKTNRFIIVAADGKLTTRNNSKGLNLKADKVHGLDDMCVGICGSWKTLSNTVGVLKRRFRYVKNERAKRPTVSELADFLKEELKSCHDEESGIILGAFDQLELQERRSEVPPYLQHGVVSGLPGFILEI
ncbi:uncharacterized protein LOC113305288 [Papaver somniferum]|uniref:uncharacterized protein LOC113305288 n=1 Tax=Papaver somniferum TaxID=3469 RepID=UPI000E6F9E77|nr:uncharacterized protein LOC113305288 [Papaver somniferum]